MRKEKAMCAGRRVCAVLPLVVLAATACAPRPYKVVPVPDTVVSLDDDLVIVETAGKLRAASI